MDKAFGMVTPSAGTFTFLWIFGVFIGLILLGIVGLFAYFGYQANHMTFTVTDSGLKIGPGLFGRFIPREDIDLGGISAVNLNLEPEYKPKWRTNGFGLPGYSGGWYKLQNRQKALVFVTDRANVVYIPTYKDYAVMLSVREPGDFMKAMLEWK
jgi:hypothetical protein